MTECKHPPKACLGDDLSPNENAMLDHLHELMQTRQLTGAFVCSVYQGFMDREHVDAFHPAQVEHAAALFLDRYPEGDTREGWLLGYRFVERMLVERSSREVAN